MSLKNGWPRNIPDRRTDPNKDTHWVTICPFLTNYIKGQPFFVSFNPCKQLIKKAERTWEREKQLLQNAWSMWKAFIIQVLQKLCTSNVHKGRHNVNILLVNPFVYTFAFLMPHMMKLQELLCYEELNPRDWEGNLHWRHVKRLDFNLLRQYHAKTA